jgi:hypothetical protein
VSPNQLQLDIANDYQVFDNLETVTYFRRTSNSGFDGGTVIALNGSAGALREVGSRFETQHRGSNVQQTLSWNLPTALVGSFAFPVAPNGIADPKVNDVIQDAAGVRWSVVHVDSDTLQTRWYLTTMQERH